MKVREVYSAIGGTGGVMTDLINSPGGMSPFTYRQKGAKVNLRSSFLPPPRQPRPHLEPIAKSGRCKPLVRHRRP